MSLFLFLLLIIDVPIKSLCINQPSFHQLYVIPTASLRSDESDGSIASPYSSVTQALDHIERRSQHNSSSIHRTIINLYPTYHFDNTIHFRHVHSHTTLKTMSAEDIATFQKVSNHEYQHHISSMASISGGIPVTNWTKVSGNTYSAIVPRLTFVNQLFVNNRRIVRTRVPTNYSEYLQFVAPLNDSTQARYGFQYASGQFNYSSLDNAMVIVYHCWTESHHYIDRLIPENNTVLFTNPSQLPMSSFPEQSQRRFHIENLCEALVPNSFCFVNETKTIYLMTDGSYDPTTAQIITSINDFILIIASNDTSTPVEDIIIDNVAIQHSAWNITRTEQAEEQAAAFITTAAVFIANATSITMSNIEVSHTGTFGIWIREGTSDINIINSIVTDTGAGGIRMGQTITPVQISTSSINIISNEVSYGGNVFPSAVAVLSHRAFDVIIADNVIHHHRYSGISIGWEWGYGESYTRNMLIKGNYIYSIGQHILSDEGGIYTLGIQPGTVIHGNVIKNVYSYSTYAFGIYLDEGSSDIVVSNNVVYNILWGAMLQDYGANNTIINNVFARSSLSPPQPIFSVPDGDIRISRGENHRTWTLTRNIIYDTYNGINHTVYHALTPAIAQFDNNVYYNPFGALLLFGTQRIPFEEWQKTGQDNNSVIADPLFAGDVNQCDFFTVQSSSPAAKLGFVNITKLEKWTSGCDDDESITNNQFYHW